MNYELLESRLADMAKLEDALRGAIGTVDEARCKEDLLECIREVNQVLSER